MKQIYASNIKQAWQRVLDQVLLRQELVVVDTDIPGSRTGGETLEILNTNINIYYPTTEWEAERTPRAQELWSLMMIEEDHNRGSEEDYYTWLYTTGQLDGIKKRIREKTHTRRAWFTFWSPDRIDTPTALSCMGGQFIVRDEVLHLSTIWRSNDALNCFPHNCLGFIKLQHRMAEDLALPVGHYTHHVISMHIYQQDKILAWEILNKLEEEDKDEGRYKPF